MLRQVCDEANGELSQLQRALGTATHERDAALSQQRSQADALSRLQATFASQATVIAQLDDERAAAVHQAGP